MHAVRGEVHSVRSDAGSLAPDALTVGGSVHVEIPTRDPDRRGAFSYAGTATAQTGQNAQPAPSPAPSATSSPPGDDVAALREEVRALRAEVEAQKAAAKPDPAPAAPPPPPPRPLGYESFWPWILPPEGLSPRGYVQSQYETHQDSQDQLTPNGTPLNKDRFSIRRARVSLTGEWQYAAVALELDANTTNGPQVDLRKAEASLQYRPDRAAPPIVMATLGLFDAPFGYELVESPRTRFFMERIASVAGLLPGRAGSRASPRGRARASSAGRSPRRTASRWARLAVRRCRIRTQPRTSSSASGSTRTPLPDLHVAGGRLGAARTGVPRRHAGARRRASSGTT